MRAPRLPSPGLVTAAMAALAPLWVTYVLAQFAALTVGRLLIITLAATVAAALWSGAALRLPGRAGCVALAALVAAALLVTGSVLTNGCTCSGAAYGFGESITVAVLVAMAVMLAPLSAPGILGGIAIGAVLMAVLALAGVGPLHSSFEPLASPPGGRLAGPLSNSNLLGMYLSLALPVLVLAVLRGRGRLQVLAAAATLPCAWALLQTYSRGALLAALVGTAVVVAAAFVDLRRHRRRFAVVCVGATVLGLVVLPAFERGRRDADYGALVADARAIDRSGWDARTQGPIPTGPSLLANAGPSELAVGADQPGEGVSIPLAKGRAGARYSVQFTATGNAPYLAIAYALQDNRRADVAPRVGFGAVSAQRARRFALSWTAPVDVDNPRFYAWGTRSAGIFALTDVVVTDPAHPSPTTVSPVLLGSLERAQRSDAVSEERRGVASRDAVLRESLRQFAGHPITGIGWQRFPGRARDRLGANGAYATHNEYARFLAELGVVGALVLLVLLAALACALRRLKGRDLRAALAGVLASGAIGLLFVNALAQPSVSLFLAIAVGVVIGLSGERLVIVRPRRGEAPVAH